MRVERMTKATENIKPIKKERGAPEQPAQKAEAPQELQQARVLEFKKTERTQKAQELVAEIQRNVPQEQKEELLDRQEARAWVKLYLRLAHAELSVPQPVERGEK